MRATFQREQLEAAVSAVAGAVPSRTNKEILKCVLLECGGAHAVLVATDQEVSIRYELAGADVRDPGQVLLPAPRLTQILKETRGDTVGFEIEKGTRGTVVVTAERSEFRLASPDPLEFPTVPAWEDQPHAAVPIESLRGGIKRTIFAADTQATRYALGGVHFEFEGEDTLTLAATDSRRMSVAVCRGVTNVQGGTKARRGAVVPTAALQLILRALPDGGDVLLAIDEKRIVMKAGPATVSAQLVQGRFPNYRQVIPQASNVNAEMVVSPLLSVVRQSMIVTNPESRGVDFDFREGNLTLRSMGKDVGESQVTMPVALDDGAAIQVSLDPRFVADFLRVLEPADGVTLRMLSPDKAVVFEAPHEFLYVVMPLAPEE